MAEVIHRYIGAPPKPPKPTISPEERKKKADRAKLDDELTQERSRSVRSKRIMSDLILAKARNELIPKEMVQSQAAYLFVALRQQLMQLPQTYARRILNISDIAKAKAILTTAAHQLLGELQDLPSKVTDPNWLKELEAEDRK